ncbi:MAG: YceI family protein [Tannerellaceae bacterium]
METREHATKTKWIIDPAHSKVGFKVNHNAITYIQGEFNDFTASIYTRGEDFSKVEIDCSINPASVHTGNEEWDTYIRSEAFFDCKAFPQIHFEGNTVEPVDNDGSFSLYGELTLKDMTHQIKLDVEFRGLDRDPWGNVKAGFVFHGSIDRSLWGMEWDKMLESSGVKLDDKILVYSEVQLAEE